MKTSKTTLSLIALASSMFCGRLNADNPFLRGDTNQDSRVDLSDAQTLLSFLFIGKGDVVLECQDAADANDDGELDITDSVRILDFLFIGQAAPPAPNPSKCGVDTTKDRLGCNSFAPCLTAPLEIVEAVLLPKADLDVPGGNEPKTEPTPEVKPDAPAPEVVVIEEIEPEIIEIHVEVTEVVAIPVQVTFFNITPGLVNVYQVDYWGEAHHVRELGSRQSFDHPTFAGTHFRFDQSGLEETYTATDEPTQYHEIDMGYAELPTIEVTIEIVQPEPIVSFPMCDRLPHVCEIVANAEDINRDGYLTLYDVLPDADANDDTVVTGPELREFAGILQQVGTIALVESEETNSNPVMTLFNYVELVGSFDQLTIATQSGPVCTQTVATNGGAVTVVVPCD